MKLLKSLIHLSIKDISSDSEEETSIFPDVDSEECSSEDCIAAAKRLLSYMDTSVNPCDDFFEFTCGGYLNENEVNKYTYQGKLEENVLKNLRELLEMGYQNNKNLNGKDKELDEKTFNKIKTIYTTCINENDSIKEKKELLFDYINNFNITETLMSNDKDGITLLLANLHNNGIDFLFKVIERDLDKMFIPYIKFSDNKSKIQMALYLYEINTFVNKDSIADYENLLLTYEKYIRKVLENIYDENQSKIKEMTNSIITVDKMISHKMIEPYQYLVNGFDIEFSTESLFTDESTETYNSESLFTDESTETYNVDHENIDVEYEEYGNYENTDEVESMSMDEFWKSYEEIADYNKNINNLNKEYPLINWNLYFEKRLENSSLNKSIKNLIIEADINSDVLDYIYNEVDLNDFINYCEWLLIESYMEYVSDDLKNMKKEFEKTLNENNEEDDELEELPIDDIHEKCIKEIDELMPFALGKFYVEKYSNLDINSEIKNMVENIRESMYKRFSELEWLDESTKNYAIEKLSKINEKIGYPDFIFNPEKLYKMYEYIKVDEHHYFITVLKKKSFKASKKFLSNIDESYKEPWLMAPHIVNAYYHPYENSINFPTAIFQSPNYDINQPDYLNYANIGSIIGHELNHAFDNTGKYYDSDGRMMEWWTEDDDEEFKYYSQCFIEQYNQYSFESLENGKTYKINGKKTLGENLADAGGFARSYEAWKMLFEKNPEEANKRNSKLPGLSQYNLDQLFYISYGQNYCRESNKGYLNDTHSPGKHRINGVIENDKNFAKLFNCPSNSPMNPTNKCSLY